MRAQPGIQYVGAHVSWSAEDRNYLGTVTGRTTTATTDVFHVRHFCGDAAPDVPVAEADILVRDYDTANWSASYTRSFLNRNTAPFRRVISSGPDRLGRQGWHTETLECGHIFDACALRAKARRRCSSCK